jgi:hypothetical protein
MKEDKGMAIDIEAIRKKVQELSGIRKTSNIQMWKPTAPSEHRVRGLPMKTPIDGVPVRELQFYYLEGQAGILAPFQFGKPDPIHELRMKMYSTKSGDDKQLANKLRPKTRAFLPVIVRGEESKGIVVWAMSKMTFNRVLGFFLDEDYGDILDPQTGFDLKVTLAQAPGRMFADTSVDVKGKQCKLHEDPAQAKAWLDAIPNVDEMYRLKSYEEIENILNNWMGGGQNQEQSKSDGTPRANGNEDALDALVNEVKGTPVADTKKAEKKAKKDEAPAEDDGSTSKKSLDDAFADLMND